MYKIILVFLLVCSPLFAATAKTQLEALQNIDASTAQHNRDFSAFVVSLSSALSQQSQATNAAISQLHADLLTERQQNQVLSDKVQALTDQVISWRLKQEASGTYDLSRTNFFLQCCAFAVSALWGVFTWRLFLLLKSERDFF